MRILILSDIFLPEISPPSFRIGDHARYWLEEGHEVTVVTCVPNLPSGKVFRGYNNRTYQEEWLDGIHVIRVWSYMTANAGFTKRILDQASFMCSAVLFSLRYPDFDVILATSPPFFVALAGYMLSLFSKRPWVFEIRDLWPASIKAVGMGDKVPMRFLERVELFLYGKADRIISLTHSFKENLSDRGIPEQKIDVIPNGVNADLFNPDTQNLDVRNELGVAKHSFLVGYIGSVGIAQGLENLVEAAKLCSSDPRIRFLIMGEGSERRRLEENVKASCIDNVIFRDFVAHEVVPHYLASLDLFLVHLRPNPLFRTVIPSKIFECMAMGVPMIYAVEGEGAKIVKECEAGVCIPSGEPKNMADIILSLSRNPVTLTRMGAMGRAHAVQKYGRRSRASDTIRSFQRVLAELSTT